MKATKTVTWESKGKVVRVEIAKERAVRDNISYADGYNVNLGKETFDALKINIYVDNKWVTRSNRAPSVVTRQAPSYDKIKAAGGYARLGSAYINEDGYKMVTTAISELETEVAGSDEFAEIKAQEESEETRKVAALEAESKTVAQAVNNGLCPKCGSYCYGDCGAN
ncbi:MAG TPA: hypothetical protein PLN60_11330 [Bacillota bacterium]|nr:hypothetical protein [Bacillota bacterium]